MEISDMESENFGHPHPVVLLNESEQSSNQSTRAYCWCSRCREKVTSVSGPSYRCVEEKCGFYIHKMCGEAPMQMNHPFHPSHPLLLLPNQPHVGRSCDFCTEICEMFISVYRCNVCDLNFHIKCALFTYYVAEKNWEELQHVALFEDSFIYPRDDGNEHLSNCFVCREPLANSTYFSLDSGINLHEMCAEAPSQINHPFHPNHSLLLRPYLPYYHAVCNFCSKQCKMLFYRCYSCYLYLHIKCALFTYNIAQKNFKEVQHVALFEGPFISTRDEHLSKCSVCWEPLANSAYFSLDCGFNLHKVCAELPLELNHVRHRKHPLLLQFLKFNSTEWFRCYLCEGSIERRFVYSCSPCKLVAHVQCASPLPVIEHKSHPHPFILFQRRVSFICDACGTEGFRESYICSACNIKVHKRCISLPPVIRSYWHDHNIFHKYFLEEEDFESRDCVICHDGVNLDHGSYSCLDCKIIFHVDCVTKYEYSIVSLENEGEKSSHIMESFTCVRKNAAEEAIEIKHTKHRHNLTLSDKIIEYDKCCDGCLLPILVPFYYCSLCDFSLHTLCAKLPQMKHFWFHDCRPPLTLQNYADGFFRCYLCDHASNGFAYECTECKEQHCCLRCVIARTPGARTCLGHEHSLLLYKDYEGQCNGCGDSLEEALCCKSCDFSLCFGCFSLPVKARHKCDDHLLTLTYYDNNDYSESHYYDICERKRYPNYWFYHCATCDTSAHPRCVIGECPFIKLGSICKETNHPHPLTFIKSIYYYPKCSECNKPCQDLALQCKTSGCNYIVDGYCL